jgi:hypothetical protein
VELSPSKLTDNHEYVNNILVTFKSVGTLLPHAQNHEDRVSLGPSWAEGAVRDGPHRRKRLSLMLLTRTGVAATGAACRLRRMFIDLQHLDLKGEGFPGQGMIPCLSVRIY